MNLKRGFRRIFILGTCLWAFACLVVLPYRLREVASERHFSRYQICLSTAEVDPITEKIRRGCFTSADRDFNDEHEKSSWPRFYKENWRLLAALIVGGSSLTYLAALTLVWMYRGFRI